MKTTITILFLSSLLLFIVISILRSSPKRQEKLRKLGDMQFDLRQKLIAISLEQAILLNKNLEKGTITQHIYFQKMMRLKEQLYNCEVDEYIYNSLPHVTSFNVSELLKNNSQILTYLEEMKDLSPDEFEEYLSADYKKAGFC